MARATGARVVPHEPRRARPAARPAHPPRGTRRPRAEKRRCASRAHAEIRKAARAAGGACLPRRAPCLHRTRELVSGCRRRLGARTGEVRAGRPEDRRRLGRESIGSCDRRRLAPAASGGVQCAGWSGLCLGWSGFEGVWCWLGSEESWRRAGLPERWRCSFHSR